MRFKMECEVTIFFGGVRVVVSGLVFDKLSEELIFAAMERNAAQVTDFFRLPVDQVVEIGRQVAI